MNIRLLYVVRPAVGGMANHIRTLCTQIDPTQFSITLASPALAGSALEHLPVSHLPLPIADRLSPLADLRVINALRHLVHQGAYDLVHVHGLKAAILATIAAHHAKIPLVITLHNRLPDPKGKLIRHLTNAVLRWVLHQATQVVVVSQAQADVILHRRLLAPQYLTVIPNGISLAAFTGCDVDVASMRRSFGIPNDCVLVLMVGRMIVAKGVGDLLTAAQTLSQQGRYRFLLAGAGPDLALFQQTTKERGLAAQVHFLGHRNDISTLLHCVDIFVLPSHSEGMPLTVLEAMAASKPIVATRVGGIPELIVHNETGLLVEPQQPAALAAAIHQLAQDPHQRQTLGQAAREHVARHFSDAEMVRKLVAVYLNFAML